MSLDPSRYYIQVGNGIYQGDRFICYCSSRDDTRNIVTAVNFYMELLDSKEEVSILKDVDKLLIVKDSEIDELEDSNEEGDGNTQ